MRNVITGGPTGPLSAYFVAFTQRVALEGLDLSFHCLLERAALGWRAALKFPGHGGTCRLDLVSWLSTPLKIELAAGTGLIHIGEHGALKYRDCRLLTC